MLDFGLFTIPLLSLLAVFSFAVVSDVNIIAFEVQSIPRMAQDMGFDTNNIRDTIMYRIYTIVNTAKMSKGVTYSTISDMRLQSLKNISSTLGIELGIENGVLAIQGVLGLIPYHLKAKLMQEGDTLHLIITGYSSDNTAFILNLKSDAPVFDSAQIIKGQAGFMRGANDTRIITANADIEIRSLLKRAAEAIIDRIDPYLLARYYFVLESSTGNFSKTIPQLMRCIEILSPSQQVWPLLLWGQTFYIRNEYDKAIELYQRISEIDPQFSFALLYWGEALAKTGKHEKAIEMYQNTINTSRFYPNYPITKSAAYSLWADSLIAMGKISEAENILRVGVNAFSWSKESNSATALSYNALGKFLMNHKNDYPSAEYYLRQAMYMDNDPQYYAALQEVIAKMMPGYAPINYATPQNELNLTDVESIDSEEYPAESTAP